MRHQFSKASKAWAPSFSVHSFRNTAAYNYCLSFFYRIQQECVREDALHLQEHDSHEMGSGLLVLSQAGLLLRCFPQDPEEKLYWALSWRDCSKDEDELLYIHVYFYAWSWYESISAKQGFCAEGVEKDDQSLVRAVYAFLTAQGVINFGILKNEPEKQQGTLFGPPPVVNTL